MLRAHRISEESAFLGQNCALCKQSFETGDLIVVCPEDGSRHHDHCWRANGNHCTAYGCTGEGQIGVSVGPARRPTPTEPTRPIVIPNTPTGSRAPSSPPGSKVRVFPARNFGCARSCLVLVVLLLLALLAATCFGIYTFGESLYREFGAQLPGSFAAAQIALSAVRDLFVV